MKKTMNLKPGTMNTIAWWQGKRREQVELAATLFIAVMGGIFMIAVVLTILKIVN